MFNSNKREDAANQNNTNSFGQFNARMGLKDRRNQARGVLASDFGASAQRTNETAAGLGNAVTSMGGPAGELMKKKGG